MTTPPPQHLTLTTQPIHFTSDYSAWKEFYLQLGLAETEANELKVTVLAADSGQLLLGEVPAHSPLDGVHLMEFTVPDLDTYATSLEDRGTPVQWAELAHRSGVVLDLPQGRMFVVQSAISAGAAPFDPAGLTIGGLLYTPADTIASGTQALAPYGLSPRIASDNGGWTDLIGNGLFAFHEGPLQTVENDAPNQPLVQIFAETGDLEAYMTQLESRSLGVALIDEAYARTLHITQPDGRILTVNETQQDLYGFHRLDS